MRFLSWGWIVVFTGCATENPSPLPIISVPAEKVTEIDGFLIYDKQPLDRTYDVLGYVDVERRAGTRRMRVLDDLRVKALAMGGNAIVDLQREVLLTTEIPGVVRGVAGSNLGGYGSIDMTEIFRWRGTVVLLKQ